MISLAGRPTRDLELQWEIIDSVFSDRIVEDLRAAWHQFEIRSPFASPVLLQTLALMAQAAGQSPLLAICRDAQGRLAAAWPVQLDRHGILRFLQDDGSDHCIALARAELGETRCAEGLRRVIERTNARGLYFQRVLPLGATIEATKQVLAALAWPMKSFRATPCPLLCAEPGPDAGERFKGLLLGSNKRLKDYQNKLQRQEGFRFEAEEQIEGLEKWSQEFCDMHDWRWSQSPTPSAYGSTFARTALLQKLRAWQADAVLVRFAIRLKDGPAAMVVGLKCGDRLVYHHTAASPAYEKLHAGNVLIRLIGLWMAERNYRTLDFGVGDEEYKFRFANTDERLFRIYASQSRLSRLYVRGHIDERIRRSRKMQGAWDRMVNRGIRGKWATGLANARLRARIIKNVYVRASMRQRIGLIQGRFFTQREIFYSARGTGGPMDPEVRALSMLEVFAIQDVEVGLSTSTRANHYRQTHEGAVAYGIVENELVQQVSWVKAAVPAEIPSQLEKDANRIWCISQCLTARSARGRGLYPRVLKAILARLSPDDLVLIYTHTWNVPSHRGILKAGFKPLAMSLRKRGNGPRRFVSLD